MFYSGVSEDSRLLGCAVSRSNRLPGYQEKNNGLNLKGRKTLKYRTVDD